MLLTKKLNEIDIMNKTIGSLQQKIGKLVGENNVLNEDFKTVQ